MIEYKSNDDKEKIYDLLSKTQPSKDKSFVNFIYNDLLDNNYCILNKEEDNVVSCINQSTHTLLFNGLYIKASYLYGISTHPDYRLRGMMDTLMKHTLNKCERNYLMTFIEGYNNSKVYKKYGFEVVSYRKKFSIATTDIKVTNTKGVTIDFEIKDLIESYQEFSKLFDCYYIRDEEYYNKYIDYIKLSGGNIAIYRNTENKVMGYVVYYQNDDLIEVKEIIYLDSLTLYKLLRYAIGLTQYISVEVSEKERLEKLFKRSIPRKNAYVMARINSYPLFNKLYGCDVKNVKEAFNILKKPVLMNEKY